MNNAFHCIGINAYVQWVKKKIRNIPIYFNANYRTERKLVPIMDYCLLHFDALKSFLGVRLHGGSQPNFNFFNVNPQIFQRKVHLTNCLETNFHNIFNVSLRYIRRRNYSGVNGLLREILRHQIEVDNNP